MVDKWGRPEFKDFNNIAQGLRLIQSTYQNQKQLDDYQAERAEKKLLKSDANYNASLFRPGAVQLDEGSPYASEDEAREAAMRGTAGARLLGRQMAASEGEANKLLSQQANDNRYQKSLGALISWKQQNPEMDWEKAPLDMYAGVNGQKAYVDAIGLDADTEEGKARRQAAIYKAAGQKFPVFQQQKQMVQETIQSGDVGSAANILREMSKSLPIPYQLGEFDPATQSFDVQYLDSNTGQFQSAGQISMKQVMGQINKTGEQEYVTGMTLHAMAVDQGNREKRQNPMFGKNANGDRFLVIPQKQWANPNQVEIEVRNERTNEKTIFPSWEAMRDFGIQVENLDREKDQKDIEYKNQQIATSKAAMDNQNRGNRGGRKLSVSDEEKIHNYLMDQAYTNAGYRNDEVSGMTIDMEGNPVPKEQITSLNKAIQARIPQVVNLVKNENIGIQEAYQAVDRLEDLKLQKAARDAAQKIVSAPEGRREAMIRALERRNPDIATVVKDQLMASAKAKGGVEDNDTPTGEAYEGPKKETENPKVLPKDMKDWDVKMVTIDGKKVPAVLTDGGPVEITREQYEEWVKLAKDSPVKRFFKDRTLTKTDEDLRPKNNPFIRQ